MDQESDLINVESSGAEASAINLEQHLPSSSQENVACTSTVTSMVKPETNADEVAEKSGYDQLPKEMHEMRIRDEKSNSHDEKVSSSVLALTRDRIVFTCAFIILAATQHMEKL